MARFHSAQVCAPSALFQPHFAAAESTLCADAAPGWLNFRVRCQVDFFALSKEEKALIRRTESNSKGWYDDEYTKSRLDWKACRPRTRIWRFLNPPMCIMHASVSVEVTHKPNLQEGEFVEDIEGSLAKIARKES